MIYEDSKYANSWETKEDYIRARVHSRRNIKLKELKLIQRIELWIMLQIQLTRQI